MINAVPNYTKALASGALIFFTLHFVTMVELSDVRRSMPGRILVVNRGDPDDVQPEDSIKFAPNGLQASTFSTRGQFDTSTT